MQSFKIFPKKGLEPFEIKIARFECDGKSFTLFDSGGNPVPKEAFLSFEDVAAILPEGKQPDSDRLIPFDVFLRKRKEPLIIYAHGFEMQTPSVKFFWLYHVDGEPQYIPDIYVASSEVVCVLPQEGLFKFRKRSMSG